MVESIAWSQKNRISIGCQNIKSDSWFYKCHFVDEGIMPGTLQTEMMLQTIVAPICHDYGFTAKKCLVNKSTVNFLNKIQGQGKLSVKAEITAEVNGLINAKTTLHFNSAKIANGSFRFILPHLFPAFSITKE